MGRFGLPFDSGEEFSVVFDDEFDRALAEATDVDELFGTAGSADARPACADDDDDGRGGSLAMVTQPLEPVADGLGSADVGAEESQMASSPADSSDSLALAPQQLPQQHRTVDEAVSEAADAKDSEVDSLDWFFGGHP